MGNLIFFLTILLLPVFCVFMSKIRNISSEDDETTRIRKNQEGQIIRDISGDNVRRWQQK